jgi:hypothetical protein
MNIKLNRNTKCLSLVAVPNTDFTETFTQVEVMVVVELISMQRKVLVSAKRISQLEAILLINMQVILHMLVEVSI